MQNSTYDPINESQFEKSKLMLNIVGKKGTITKGTTGNVDYTLADDFLLTGANLIVQNPVFGDAVSVQVVHPQAGVLAQFVTDFGINNDTQKQFDFENKYPAKLLSGLILRVAYTSTGEAVNPVVMINYILHKVLI